MEEIRNFLEKDIERLVRNIENKKVPDKQRISKEDIKKAIEEEFEAEKIREDVEIIEEEKEYLPAYLLSYDEKIKLEVEKLLEKVFQEGIEAAWREAKNKEPFIFDSFRDALADKLWSHLKGKKII